MGLIDDDTPMTDENGDQVHNQELMDQAREDLGLDKHEDSDSS